MANLLTASVTSTVAGVVSLALGFIANVVTARLLGAHGTGLVAFAIWFATVTTTVAGLGIQNILLRYIGSPTETGEGGTGLARVLLRPYTLTTLLSAGGILLWAGYKWQSGNSEGAAVWIATAIFSIIFAYASLSLSAARGFRDFATSSRQIFIGCMAQVPAVLFGAYFFGAAGALLGQMVRHLPTALALRKYVGPKAAGEVVTPAMRSFGRNTWLSSVIGLFIWTRIEFVFLAINHEAADVGYFAVGMTLAGLVVQLPEQMSAALMPYFGRHHDNNDLVQLERSYQRVFRWVGLFIFPICFGGAAIMFELLPLLFGAEFVPAVPSATILLATACITAMTIFPSAMISARERSIFFIWASPAIAGVMVVLLWLIVPANGAVGASIARALVHSIWLAALVGYCWSRLAMAPPLFDLLRIAASAGACAGGAYLVLWMVGGIPGLVLSIAAGALVYMLSLRLTGAIPAEDVETLGHNLGSALPGPVARLAISAIQLIAASRSSKVISS